MMDTRILAHDRVGARRRAALVVVLVGLMLSAMADSASASASDGELIESGNTDRASHVVDGGSFAKVTFDAGVIYEDCPTGASYCRLETRWRSKKDCTLCVWSTDSLDNAIRLAPGTVTRTHCQASGNYQMVLQVRAVWGFPASTTTEVRGTTEYQNETGISQLVTKYIPVGLRISGGAGFTLGTVLETKTVSKGSSGWYNIASSGSNYVSTSC